MQYFKEFKSVILEALGETLTSYKAAISIKESSVNQQHVCWDVLEISMLEGKRPWSYFVYFDYLYEMFSDGVLLEQIVRKLTSEIVTMYQKTKSDLCVRYLNEDDIDALKVLEGKDNEMLNHIDFELDMVDDSGFFVGLFNGERLLGFCTLGGADCETDAIYRKEDGILSNVYIGKSERDMGYGTYLVRQALLLAKEQFPNAFLHIDLLRPSLAKWYKDLGFFVTGEDKFGVYAMKQAL